MGLLLAEDSPDSLAIPHFRRCCQHTNYQKVDIKQLPFAREFGKLSDFFQFGQVLAIQQKAFLMLRLAQGKFGKYLANLANMMNLASVD
jgi:hypothetical protein